MTTIFSADVNGNEVLKLTQPDSIILEGNINGNSDVKFVSEAGFITLEKDINSNANLLAVALSDVKFQGEFNSESGTKLVSKTGNVVIGKDGEQKNVNSSARLSVTAGRDVIFHHTDFNAECEVHIVSKGGSVMLKGDINSNTKLYIIAENSIYLEGDINSNVVVEMICTQGSITITGHIHSNARVRLTAAENILIKKEIDGNLSVVARCEGKITVMGDVNNHAYVELRAHEGIHIQGNVSDHSTAKLSVSTSGIIIDGNVDGNSEVFYWPNMLSLQGNGTPVLKHWVTEYAPSLDSGKTGDWWNNWLWSYGFVSNQIHRPKSYQSLQILMISLRRMGVTKVKAMGGSWSSSDVALPQDDDASVDNVSILKRGENNTNDLRYALRHMAQKDTPMDMFPTELNKSLDHSSHYDTPTLQRVVKSGIDLKLSPPEYAMVDTKFMASSLQHQLKTPVVYVSEGGQSVAHYRYWVEAGITMSDLNELLDHNLPRLAIQASGGSPGATLAGTISTATHGGEFKAPLLVDRILAVHLIGPGGLEWWIEGVHPVMDKADIQALYPAIPDSRFISQATWSHPDISAQNFLKAVVTSMGTMGIIYSVVLGVVEQFSVEQVTYKYPNWERMLKEANVSELDLENKVGQANEDVLAFLMNGLANKTGIATADNQYIDLAINPLSKSCWVVNRKFVDMIAEDENQLDTMSNYVNSVSSIMSEGADLDGIMGSKLAGRLLDFLSIPRDSPGIMAGIGNISNFMRSVTNSPLLLSSLMAHTQAKAMWNQWSEPDFRRGTKFMADVLEGILDALQGTYEEPKASIAGLSYKVGAIGWPSTGIPGRAFEVALKPEIAFSYIQALLKLIDAFAATNRTFMGYLSVRVCPQTNTLMGMQQFGRHSVMVEVVAHRSPEASFVIDELIEFTKNYDGFQMGEFPPFHWGLDTEGFDAAYLAKTPFGVPFAQSGKTKIDLFKLVKDIIRDGNPAWFDNRFVARMGL